MGKQHVLILAVALAAATYLVWLATRPPTVIERSLTHDERVEPDASIGLATAGSKPLTMQADFDVEWLLRELLSHDGERRTQAYHKAAQQESLPAHEPLVRLLLCWLQSGARPRYGRASVLLNRMGDAVLPRIAALHAAGSAQARWHGVLALLQCHRAGVDVDGPCALALLEDPDKRIRDLTMKMVAAGMPYDEALAQRLLEWLRPKDGASIFGPELALARMGPKGIAHLLAILDDPTSDMHLTVLGGLAGAKPEALKPVLPRIAAHILRGDEAVAEAALFVLQRMQGDCASCLPALQTALEDESFLVVQAALHVMRQMGTKGAPAVDQVLALLEYGDERVEDAAATVLGALGARSAVVIPALGALVRDDARVAPARALAEFGAAGLAQLLRHFDEGEEDVREAVLEGLKELGPAAAPAVPRLVALIEGEDLGLRLAAVRVAGRIGPGAAAAVPAIVAHAFAGRLDEDWAADALVVIGNAAEEPLRAGLRSKDATVRLRAVAMVSSMDGRTGFALRELGALLDDPDSDIRMQAVQAIASAPEGYQDGAMPPKEPDPTLREPVRKLLQRAVKDEDKWVRMQAEAALEALGDTTLSARQTRMVKGLR